MSSRPVRNFSAAHRFFETVQAAVTAGRWPARLAELLRITPKVDPIRQTLTVRSSLGQAARLRVAFAADWHAGPSTSLRTLEGAVAAIEAARPDVVLLGGDFVSLRAKHGLRLIPLFRRLVAGSPVYAVLGNHDHFVGADVVLAQLEQAGVVPLENRGVGLPPPFEHVSIVGIDDHMSGTPDATRAFEGAGEVRILLMHQPSGLLDVNADHYDVAFAGHTHGGQIVVPGLPPLYVPKGRLSRAFLAGRFETDRGVLFVSRGVGCTLLPVRWNAPADVLIVDLTSPER
jgi:predicted MPP superfamily phosphohydrolase